MANIKDDNAKVNTGSVVSPDIIQWVASKFSRDIADAATIIAAPDTTADVNNIDVNAINPEDVAFQKAPSKLDVFTTLRRMRKNNPDALIADTLLNAYGTDGVAGYMAEREKLFGAEPVVYADDKGVGKDLANARFEVTTINNPDTFAVIQAADANGTLQVLPLDEGEESLRNKHDTAWGTRNIGRDKLYGINANDKYVLYDDSTGRYYRYYNEADEEYTTLKTNIAFYENVYNTRVAQHEAITEDYMVRMQKARTRTAYYRLQREYEEWYAKSATAITEVSTKLAELQQSNYLPNEAYTQQLDAWLAERNAVRDEMLHYGSYMADYDNAFQTNSLADIVKNGIRNIGKDGYFELLMDDVVELVKYYKAPITGLAKGDLSVSQASTALLLNAMVNFGETMDVLAAPVKAEMLAEVYGYNKEEAMRSTIGGDWKYGNVNFDYNTGNFAVDIVCEVLSDPSTYISLFTTALPKLAADGLQTTVIKAAKDAGLDIATEQAEAVSKQALRMIATSGAKPEAAIKDALIRNLTSKDVHKVLAALDDANFSTSNKIAQHIINSKSFTSPELSTIDIARILKGTKVSEKEFNKILAVCTASRRTFEDAISGAAKAIKGADEIKLALSMQKLRKLDDTYTTVVKWLTIAPPIAAWRGAKKLSKSVFKNVHIPDAYKGYILGLYQKIASSVPTKNDVVTGERIVTDFADAVERLSMYAKVLEGDEDLAKALQDVKNEWVSVTYNNIIANTVKEFNEELTVLLSKNVFDTTTPEDVARLFDEVAKRVSDGKFNYAELFVFASKGSLYADALNSLNRQSLAKLENLRELLYTRTAYIANADTFKAVETGISRVNDALANLFNGDLNSAYIIATYEEGVSILKTLANQHKDAVARDELHRAIAPLEDHLTLYRASLNAGEVGGYNKAVTHRAATLAALDEVYAALEKHYGDAINDVSIKEVIKATDRALGNLAPSPAEAAVLSVKDIVKRVFDKAGAVVTDAELEALLVRELDKSKLNIMQTHAVIDVSNIAKHEVLFNSPEVYTAVESVLDPNSPVGKLLANAAVHGDDYLPQMVIGNLYGYLLERNLLRTLETAGLPTHVEVAIKDALAGDAIYKINYMVNNTDFTSAASVDHTVQRICDLLQEDSQAYMQGITAANRNVQMYSNHIGDAVVSFNTANADLNVRNMLAHAQGSGFLAEAVKATADDKVHDIYYSIVKVSKAGEPLQIAFADSVTGEVFSYKLATSDDVYNMSDDVARKMYGVDAAKCKAAAKDAPGELHNVSDMWDAVQYQLRNFASAYGQVRYVGFNAGMTYSGQERVFRNCINKYGLTHGEFVDLADVIRRTEFPETYIDDDILNNIEMIIRQHLHNINDVRADLNDTRVSFGVAIEDLTNGGIKRIADDLRVFAAGNDSKHVSKDLAMTVLNKEDMPALAQQISVLAGIESASRASLKASSIPDSTEVVVNMDALKELYYAKTGEHLNIMHMLRTSQDNAINIRYMYQMDEAARWFKDDKLASMSVEQLSELHKVYKNLMYWEAAIKDTHVADTYSDDMYKNTYIELTRNLRAGYKYNKIYDLAIRDGVLDFDKMNKTQRFALLLAMREFSDISASATSDATYKVLYSDGLYYSSLLAAQVSNYRRCLREGFDISVVTDVTEYNTYNTMLRTVLHASSSAARLDGMVNDLTNAEAFFKELETVYGRGAAGYELATLKSYSGEVFYTHTQFTKLKNELYEAASEYNDMLASGKYDEDLVDRVYKAQEKYANFVKDLEAKTARSNTTVLSNVMEFSDELFYAHLKGNCSGTMLIQLDSEAYQPIQDRLLDWMLHLETLDNIKLSKKDCVFNGTAHPVFVIKYVGEDSGEKLYQAIQRVQHASLKDDYTMFPSLAEHLPMSYRLSDYTPANADATRRILEFSGDSAKVANDTVQRMQHYDVYTTGFNCSVLGDVEFVRTFYPYRSSSVLTTVEQALVHNLSKLAECTYGTSILKTGIFDLRRYIGKDTTYEELVELIPAFRYTMCTLDDNGKPIKVKFTKDMFDEAVNSKRTKYSIVPEEFFEQSLSTYEKLTTKEGYRTESQLAYKKRMLSNALSQVILAYKQGALFTNIATGINNLLGGAMNFAADESITDAVKLAKYSQQNQLAHRIYTMLAEETPNMRDVDNLAIRTLYKNHPELEDLLPQEDFIDWCVIKSANGGLGDVGFQKMLDTQPKRLVNEAVKLNGLELSEEELAEFTEYMRLKCGVFNTIFDNHYSKQLNEYDWAAVQKELNEHFAQDTSKWANVAQTVSMQYLPTRKRIGDISKIPVLGKYYAANQHLFSSVEDYLRYSITMHFMEKGHTRADAIDRMLRSQFDYSNQPKLVQALDRIAPFATYRVCNTQHWLFNVNAGANRMLANLAQYQAVYDPMEIARVMYWTRYFEEHPEESEESEDTSKGTTAWDQLLAPSASRELYQSRQGKFKLPGNHYLKNTAPYFEAMELFTQVYLACTNYDAFKQLLKDNVFQPVVELGELLDAASKGELNEPLEYYAQNYYDVHGLIPVFGALMNRIYAHIKAGNANKLSAADLKALFTFGESNAYALMDAALGTVATLMPDLVGTYKSEKPVGYNWNEQSEEYKATHRFIYGVSSLPAFFTKNPAQYVDHAGLLMELGYTKEEAIELLTKGWYFDLDGNVHQYNIYEDEEMPDVFKYEPEMFDNTLRYLLERGYSIDAAYTYMKSFGKWVDEDGNVRGLDDVELLWKQSLEAKQYYQIPAYIRNIPDQYSKQLQYYKSLGYTTEQARFAMTSQPIFIDADGNVQVLDNGTIYALNSAYKYNRDYETDVKLESTATQYIDNIKTPNIKALKRLVAEERVHVSGGRAHQASSYPGRYRESHSMDIRQKLYKEVYGLNNIANNRLRYAMSHSHYRSANRYRAEMVRNIFRYL